MKKNFVKMINVVMNVLLVVVIVIGVYVIKHPAIIGVYTISKNVHVIRGEGLVVNKKATSEEIRVGAGLLLILKEQEVKS